MTETERFSAKTENVIKELFKHVEHQQGLFLRNMIEHAQQFIKENDEIDYLRPVQVLAVILFSSARKNILSFDFVFQDLEELEKVNYKLMGTLMRNEMRNLDQLREMIDYLQILYKKKHKKALKSGSIFQKRKESDNAFVDIFN